MKVYEVTHEKLYCPKCHKILHVGEEILLDLPSQTLRVHLWCQKKKGGCGWTHTLATPLLSFFYVILDPCSDSPSVAIWQTGNFWDGSGQGHPIILSRVLPTKEELRYIELDC